ncbi:cell envelope biogenesis protein OmpA [Streptomyces sp. NPDC056773]
MDQLTSPSAATTPLRRSWLTRRLHIDLLRVCSATAPAL